MNQREREHRVRDALANTHPDDVVAIVLAATDLQRELYKNRCENRCGGDKLFLLRKALEGVFGHDLPETEEE